MPGISLYKINESENGARNNIFVVSFDIWFHLFLENEHTRIYS